MCGDYRLTASSIASNPPAAGEIASPFSTKFSPAFFVPFAAPNELLWAWSQLAQARGSISIQDLADDIGWSRRHFSERFRREIGITPKTAARIFRFEHSCRLMKKNRPPSPTSLSIAATTIRHT